MQNQNNKKIEFNDLLSKSKRDLIEIILRKSDLQVPITIFENDSPPLESLVKYLKEKEKLSIKEIALRLNRKEQTIWTTYYNSLNKKINIRKTNTVIPLSIFSKNKFSILESLTNYLTTYQHLELSEIARLTNRNIKTIWTVKNRYKIKKGELNE